MASNLEEMVKRETIGKGEEARRRMVDSNWWWKVVGWSRRLAKAKVSVKKKITKQCETTAPG